MDASNLQTGISQLLVELSDTQDQLLALLGEKQRMLRSSDFAGLEQLTADEQVVLARLQACHQQRGALLAQARAAGLPDASLASLAEHLPEGPGEEHRSLQRHVRQTASRNRILQHQSLTNWVLAQRSILHISQMLEILATGRPQRTNYGRGEACRTSGALMDQQG